MYPRNLNHIYPPLVRNLDQSHRLIICSMSDWSIVLHWTCIWNSSAVTIQLLSGIEPNTFKSLDERLSFRPLSEHPMGYISTSSQLVKSSDFQNHWWVTVIRSTRVNFTGHNNAWNHLAISVISTLVLLWGVFDDCEIRWLQNLKN